MPSLSFRALLIAVAFGPVLAAPALAQSSGNIFTDIFKPPGSVQQQPDAAANAQSEMLLRMDRLENTVRQLTGQVEQLQYRLQQMEAGGARPPAPGAAPAVALPPPTANRAPVSVPSSAPLPPPGAPPAATGRRSDAFDPNAASDAPGAPQPLGSPTSGSAGLGTPTEIAPGGVAPVSARPGAQVAALPPSNTPKDLFDLGYGYIQRQDYAAADQTFRQFLQAYPSDRLVPEATYFLGESLFQRQSYKDAAENFLQVSTKFPNAPRAPEALLRLGQSLAGLNEREAACATLGEIDRKYPRASSNVRQAVEREQKRAGC